MYVLDPWWNLALDFQALYRIHRIGQRRPVKVMTLYVGETVEDQMCIIRASKGVIRHGGRRRAAGGVRLDQGGQAHLRHRGPHANRRHHRRHRPETQAARA
jgi:hypothetical protein